VRLRRTTINWTRPCYRDHGHTLRYPLPEHRRACDLCGEPCVPGQRVLAGPRNRKHCHELCAQIVPFTTPIGNALSQPVD